MASRKGGVGGGGHSGGFTIDMDQDRPAADPEEGGSEDTRPLLEPTSQGKPAFLTPPPDASSDVRGVVDRHNRCCDNKFWCIKARRTRKTKSRETVQFNWLFCFISNRTVAAWCAPSSRGG